MSIQTKEYSINGLLIPVLDGGNTDSDEAIVFIHGFPGAANDWRPFLEALSPYSRVIALTMPGFGGADKPNDFDYSVENYVPVISSLLSGLDVEKVHLVMHDFGGAWGMNWAAQNIDKMKSFTLINTGLFLEEWHSLAKIFRTPIIGELFSLLPPYQPAFNSMISCNGANKLNDEQLIELKSQMDYGTRRAMMKLYRNTDARDQNHYNIADQFYEKDFPAMVIWGEDDPYLPSTLASKQLKAFPHAEIHMLKDCGHWPFLEQESKVHDLLLKFFLDFFEETHAKVVPINN